MKRVLVVGPVLAVVVGWLCSAGTLSLGLALPILVVGDMIGDSGFYLPGRFTSDGRFERLAMKIGCGPNRVNRIGGVIFSIYWPACP